MKAAIKDKPKKIVILYEEKDIEEAIKKAGRIKKNLLYCAVHKTQKLGKFLNKLEEQEYDGFMVLGRDEEVRFFSE